MRPPSILVLAGEASGDYHAAALVRELKAALPELRVVGIGGDGLADAGMELLRHYRDINTIALGEGLEKLRHILSAYKAMVAELESGRHELFIPVDYPDVNLRLCRKANLAGAPVCYYISPQVWAWRKGRIRKIAARVDRMMTIFPFEETLYRQAGVTADFVGHTMARDIGEAGDKAESRRDLGLEEADYTVALAPGSRPAEVKRMLPLMARAAAIFEERFPGTQFALPLAGEHLRSTVDAIIRSGGPRIRVVSGNAARLMAAADSGLVTSGTATLQAALTGMPHAVVYVVDGLTWWVGLRILKPLVMDKDIHLAIANVLAIDQEKRGDGPIAWMQEAGYTIPCRECGRPLFVPEILQDRATPESLAEWLVRFRTEEGLQTAMRRGFDRIREILQPGAGGLTAAEIVLDMLKAGREKRNRV